MILLTFPVISVMILFISGKMSNDAVNISGRTVRKGMCLLSHWSVQTFVAGVDLLRVLCPTAVHSALKSNCYSPSSFSLSFSSSSLLLLKMMAFFVRVLRSLDNSLSKIQLK